MSGYSAMMPETELDFMLPTDISIVMCIPDGQDAKVGAGAGVDPEGPGQNQIRSESPL